MTSKTSVRNVLIVTKTGHVSALDLGRSIAAWLAERSVASHVMENGVAAWPEDLAETFDLVLVLGGDGTMLSVARHIPGPKVPLLGLNLGKVGFLAELCPKDWREKLSKILDSGLNIRPRMALTYAILRDGETISSGRAINDLVINRGGLSRLVNLDLFVDEVHVGVLRSDGLIVSTPMGSTGYGVSAGGPILHPNLEGMGVTPICPFLNEFPPLVMPASSTLAALVLPTTAEVFFTVDGQEVLPLVEGDRVEIKRCPEGLSFVCVKGSTYFAKLRAKGFIRQRGLPESQGCAPDSLTEPPGDASG